LQYLGRKTGKFYPKDERKRVVVEEWLFWQMAGLGPMAGQAHHFRNYAPEKIAYGIDRYTNEVNRLYGVLSKQLKGREYVAGEYSIADMAIYPWVRPYKNQGQDLNEFPPLAAWFQRMHDRPAVAKGVKAGEELRQAGYNLGTDKEAQKVLFGQRARKE
jgi:GST-like protein